MLTKDRRASEWSRWGENTCLRMGAKSPLGSVLEDLHLPPRGWVGGGAGGSARLSARPQLPGVSVQGSVALCIKIEKKNLVLFDTSILGRRISSLAINKLRIGRNGFCYHLCCLLAVTLSKSLNCVISPCVK